MTNFKTSTKISIYFTIFTIFVVFLFWLIVNFVFYNKWNAALDAEISVFFKHPINKFNSNKKIKNFKDKFISIISLEKDSWEFELLTKDKTFFNDIYKISDKYFYIKHFWNKIWIKDVTSHILWQMYLIYISLYLLLFFWFLAYFISLFFIKISLKKLDFLVKHVEKLDLDNLNESLPIIWPENDEINIVSKKINESLLKINKQTQSLKDFVSNASHELQTPLMRVNSDLDYALKSKNYEQWLLDGKKWIKHLSNLINELLMLTKISNQQEFKTQKLNVKEIIENIAKEVEKTYAWKNLHLDLKLQNFELDINRESFSIVVKNLLENAFKYTEAWKITIFNDEKIVKITDTWVWISQDDIERIREKFWQKDSSRSANQWFWLGLALVKNLCENNNRKIELESQEDKWTSFTIFFW